MENRVLETLVVGVIVFFICWLIGLTISWVDYSLNKAIIDTVRFTQFQWWTWITWRHWWTWLYANDLGSYLLYSGIVCIVLAGIVALIWFAREWD